MDDLIMEFVAEVREGYAALTPDIHNWKVSPENTSARDEILRFLHSTKGGAGFVKFERIEQLAIAAEQALCDCEHWGVPQSNTLVTHICDALARINGIAAAVEAGIGYPTIGEDELLARLSGREVYVRRTMPYDQMQTGYLRLPASLLEALRVHVEQINETVQTFSENPTPSALALLRSDMARHVEMVRELRYAPISQLFNGLQVLAGEFCQTHAQNIAFCIRDADLFVDRTMLPLLRNALRHLIRNAIAHGIEPPDERQKRGKPSTGTISLKACQEGDMIAIELADDGRGLDYEALIDKTAIDLGQAHELEMLERITLPGVSGAQNVSSLAGRGMGLDIVRVTMERLHGSLEMFDRPHEGFTVRLIFPAGERS